MQNKFFILLLFLLFFGIIYLLSPILTPFFIGALLAYLANPLVHQLMRFHLPRLLSVILVFIFIFAIFVFLILLIIPLIGKQIDSLVASIPVITAWLQDTLIPLLKYVGVDENQINVATVKTILAEHWTKAGGAGEWISKIMHSGFRIIEWLLNLILVPVVTFYLLCDWDAFLLGLRSLLPRRIEPTVVKLFKECNEVLGAFFRGQLLVMLSLAGIYAIGLTLIGLQTGILIGVCAGLLSIVPYLGFIVGIVIASIVAYMQFGSFTHVLLVGIVFLIGQMTENTILTPKLIGNRIGLHPVAVIFAVLAGGKLFGFLGVLLALPAAASIMVWIRYLNQQYHKSTLYKS